MSLRLQDRQFVKEVLDSEYGTAVRERLSTMIKQGGSEADAVEYLEQRYDEVAEEFTDTGVFSRVRFS